MEPEFSFRISDSKSRVIYSTPGFLFFLPALYFTMKGVDTNLQVTSFWFIINTISLLLQ